MKESYREGPASHPDPESCAGDRKVTGEALTGAHTGQPSSCEIHYSGVPTPWTYAEGNTINGDSGESLADPAQSKTLSMCGNSSHGNREIPTTLAADGATGRPEQVHNRTAGMHVGGKSDAGMVPENSSNNDTKSAEAIEGRPATKGNTLELATSWTQSQSDRSSGLQRVREVARRDRQAQFTALLHHVTVDLLRASFLQLKRQAAPGVDGVAWDQYEVGIADRIADLHRRVHEGTFGRSHRSGL